MRVDLISPSYTSRATFNDNRELQNWFIEQSPYGKFQFMLLPTPGLRQFTITNGSIVRALINYNNSLYGVSGSTFFSCDVNGNCSTLGTLTTSTGFCQMAAVPGQIMVIDNSEGYIYNVGANTFTQITDVDFPNGTQSLTTSGSRFVVVKPNTQKFFWSDLVDGTNWPALNFASATSQTSDLVAIRSAGAYLFALGRFTTEIWSLTGGTDVNIFQPVTGTYIDYGCIATNSIAQLENSMFWLTQNRYGQSIVMMTTDFNTKAVSTTAVTYQISQYTTVSDAIGYTMQNNGHSFYVLIFPTQGVTWMYDISLDSWNKLLSFNGITDGRHKSNCYAHCYGMHLVGDYQSGTIYQLSDTTYTDGGSRIRRLLRFPFPTDELKRTSIYNFEVLMERSTGLTTGQGVNPELLFRFSRDGGHTWSNERARNFNPIGNTRSRCFWLSVGQGPLPYGELVCTDPVNATVIGASAMISSEFRES